MLSFLASGLASISVLLKEAITILRSVTSFEIHYQHSSQLIDSLHGKILYVLSAVTIKKDIESKKTYNHN